MTVSQHNSKIEFLAGTVFVFVFSKARMDVSVESGVCAFAVAENTNCSSSDLTRLKHLF